MSSYEPSRPLGTSESRLERILLYTSEGAMAGAILFLGVAFLFASLPKYFDGIELWVVVLFLAFFLVAAQYAAGILLAGRSSSAPSSYTEWKNQRRWRWVLATAIPVLAILTGIIILMGWWEGQLSREAEWVAYVIFLVGLVIRMLILRK